MSNTTIATLPSQLEYNTKGNMRYCSPVQPSLDDQSRTATLIGESRYISYNALLRNSIIGFSDGLTVPFALMASLSTLNSSKLVIMGGLAELCSGAISMGLGAFLAANAQRKQYAVQRNQMSGDIIRSPDQKRAMVQRIFAKYGVGDDLAHLIAQRLAADEQMLLQFIMDFELHLENVDMKTAVLEGLIMGCSYCLGGLFPMIPYFAIHDASVAVYVSIGITAVVLLTFGSVKALAAGVASTRGALLGAVQMLVVGAAAVAASYGIARAFDITSG